MASSSLKWHMIPIWFLAHFHVLVSKHSLMTSEVRYLVSINICCFITYFQNPLPSITFQRLSFKMASNGLKMASDTKVILSKIFWHTEWSFHWSQWKMASNGLKMASDTKVILSKSFWHTERSFHWSQWKSYHFGPFSCFGLKMASNDLGGRIWPYLVPLNIFCFIIYPENLLPFVTFWRF